MRHKVTRELSALHMEAMAAVRCEAAAACHAAAATAVAAREAAALDIARVSAAALEATREAVAAREAAVAREAAAATAVRARAEAETFDVEACELRFMALRQFIELARRGAGKPKPWRITLRRASLVSDSNSNPSPDPDPNPNPNPNFRWMTCSSSLARERAPQRCSCPRTSPSSTALVRMDQ